MKSMKDVKLFFFFIIFVFFMVNKKTHVFSLG